MEWSLERGLGIGWCGPRAGRKGTGFQGSDCTGGVLSHLLDETKCFSTDAAVSAHVFSLSQVDESFIHS